MVLESISIMALASATASIPIISVLVAVAVIVIFFPVIVAFEMLIWASAFSNGRVASSVAVIVTSPASNPNPTPLPEPAKASQGAPLIRLATSAGERSGLGPRSNCSASDTVLKYSLTRSLFEQGRITDASINHCICRR